jgi:hypothetical protein
MGKTVYQRDQCSTGVACPPHPSHPRSTCLPLNCCGPLQVFNPIRVSKLEDEDVDRLCAVACGPICSERCISSCAPFRLVVEGGGSQGRKVMAAAATANASAAQTAVMLACSGTGRNHSGSRGDDMWDEMHLQGRQQPQQQ